MVRYFVSQYSDGPATRWNVIDRQTQELVRRFSDEEEAHCYADLKNGSLVCWYCGTTVMYPCSTRWKTLHCPVPPQYGLSLREDRRTK